MHFIQEYTSYFYSKNKQTKICIFYLTGEFLCHEMKFWYDGVMFKSYHRHTIIPVIMKFFIEKIEGGEKTVYCNDPNHNKNISDFMNYTIFNYAKIT